MSFRINVPAVTHQLIDGEIIILNLENGYYYSLLGTAAWVWQWLELGNTEAVVEMATSHFRGDITQIRSEVANFVEQLIEEELLTEAASTLKTTACSPSTPVPYSTPVWEKHTEMSDLLLLDPIHDVDEGGWPRLSKTET